MDKWLPNERWYDNLDVLGSDYYQSTPGIHLDPGMDPSWRMAFRTFIERLNDLPTILFWVNTFEKAGHAYAAQTLRDRAHALTVPLDMPQDKQPMVRWLLMDETRPAYLVEAAKEYEAKGYGAAGNVLRDRVALLRIARRRVVPAPEIVSPWIPRPSGTSLIIEPWFDDLDVLGSEDYQNNPGLHYEKAIQGTAALDLMVKAASYDLGQVLRWAKEYEAAKLPVAAQAMRDRAATLLLPFDLGMSQAEQNYAQVHFQYETRPLMLIEAARNLEAHGHELAGNALRQRAALLRVASRRRQPSTEIVWPWQGLPEGPKPQPVQPRS
ncbi:hypothetical protein [Polyangium mundeleinium]|uniref:Uncharacterized protein n=1 Tax=Polyangium mundeleinium TaxID=2995306 RepID=A0ABT5EJN1_9BACT|nr:hypothetical protein [Polyangium mundeleinium]MDC0740965.1 hypothetical protein [Polyangium mundeleinium]